jgi:autotransporter-associated beta strand protein
MLPLAAGTVVTLGSLASSALGQTYTWLGGASGNFNVNGNWLGGFGPGAGLGSATTALNFTSGNGGAVTATNSNGSPFVANSLSFNINNVNTFSVAGGSAAGIYQLVGPSATINSNGIGNAQLVNGTSTPNWGAQLQLTDNVTFGGTGIGNVLLGSNSSTAAISQDATPRSITISGGAPLRILRNLALSGNNTFSGGLILDGGTLQAGAANNANMFGAQGSALTVTGNGGTINAANFATTLSLGTVQLTGDLHVIGGNGITFSNTTVSTPAVFQGSGNLYVNLLGNMTIAGNSNTYSGAVVIDQSEFALGAAAASAGTLTLTSTAMSGSPLQGSMTGAASYDVRAGGTLTASSNTNSNSFQNNNRISDTAPMRLRAGNFALNGPAAVVTGTAGNNYTPTNLTEKIGDLTGAGGNNITVTPTNGTNVQTTLEIRSLARLERGTFNFRSNAATLGDGSTTTRGRVILDTALASGDYVGGGGLGGSKNISILTYGAGGVSSSDGGSGFITYGNDGFRLLNTSTEYDAANSGGILSVANAQNNVRLTASTSNAAAVTLNSLLLANNGTTSDGSLTGSGTLTVTSGAVIGAGINAASGAAAQSISNNLAFGNAEAVIWANGNFGLRITGQLTGSNGLTRTGSGASGSSNALVLTADNSGLTGPLTLNSGFLQFNQDLALPGTGQIIANGGGISSSGGNSQATGLYWAGAGSTTLSRDVAVNTGTMTFRLNNASLAAGSQINIGNMHLAGTIGGVGSVNFQGQTVTGSVTTPGEVYVDNTANTYTGTTVFTNGVHIASDGSTGIGGQWDLNGGTLYFESSITNSRPINFGNTHILDTKANDVTLTGPITGFGSNWGTVSTTNGLTKNGAGTLTLTSLVNNLAGPVTVNAGTLLINGNLGPSNTNSAMAANGGTLGGSGTLYRNTWGYVKTGSGTTSSPFVYTGGGIVAPGSNGPGIMTIWGLLDLAPAKVAGGTSPNIIGTPAASGSTLSMDLNGPVAGTGYDQIQQILQNQSSAASVSLGDGSATWAANLQLSLGYAPSASDVFWLIVNSNTQPASLQPVANTTTGTFVGLPEGSSVTLGTFGSVTYTGTISYKGDYDTSNPGAGTGNDVVIYNIVPAPGSVALLGIGGLLATRRKRRMA